jgi:AraC family transcriptional regulator
MAEFDAVPVLATSTVGVWNVTCPGRIRDLTDEECATSTHLIFPYRGLYLHHVGRRHFVAEPNQVLFANQGEPYRVSHPVGGGDATLSIKMEPQTLLELSPAEHLHPKGHVAFDRSGVRVDARTQQLAATLRQRLHHGTVDAMEAEEMTVELVRHALGAKNWNMLGDTGSRPRRLIAQVKLLLSSDLGRRWTLGEVAGWAGVSPVYLTQAFKRFEDVPLYRYHLRLRLARALDLLGEYDDLTRLALDLGFTSHSHFTAAFRKVYGLTPSAFQRSIHAR